MADEYEYKVNIYHCCPNLIGVYVDVNNFNTKWNHSETKKRKGIKSIEGKLKKKIVAIPFKFRMIPIFSNSEFIAQFLQTFVYSSHHHPMEPMRRSDRKKRKQWRKVL